MLARLNFFLRWRMVFDFSSSDFYNQSAFAREVTRIFDICNGCRLCYNLCPSFKVLFERIDELDGDVAKLHQQDTRRVVELCYDCKLCFPKCPYTPPHHYMLDFPRLMLRGKAIERKSGNVSLGDRLLGHVDFIGTISSKLAPIVNWMLGSKIVRTLMEMAIGIHRDRNLPKYSHQTFVRWYKKHLRKRHLGAGAQSADQPKVVLFYTCSVNYNDTDIGKAAVQVLEANNVSIEVPQQKCCGMPYLDGGDIESALRNVQYNLKTLSAYVKSGFDVVTPGPTCTYMLKQEYPMLANSADAKLVAAHTYDIMEYLLKLEKGGKLSKAFERSAGKVIYHLPCHLKAQNIGYKSRDVLELIPNTEVEVVAKCSGHDGTWSLKKEYFELSLDVGAPLFEMLSKADDSQISSDCPLAQLQIEKGVGMKPRHPIQILRDAYGLPKNPEQ